MLPIWKILFHEWLSREHPERIPEPDSMTDIAQVRSYIKAYEWGGPTTALVHHHLQDISRLIRPGDVVLDLACGPGPLLLELAALYPECHFIGADLSAPMLESLKSLAQERNLNNVTPLNEDISELHSIKPQSVDVIISTSALHHLPNESTLQKVFQRCREVLKPEGAFYFFDFSLLRSKKAKELFVADIAHRAPPITVHDYELSLQAAFPSQLVFALAETHLPQPTQISRSALIDITYFIQSPARTTTKESVLALLNTRWQSMSFFLKIEYVMIHHFRKTVSKRDKMKAAD